jgi:hypothetical protein
MGGGAGFSEPSLHIYQTTRRNVELIVMYGGFVSCLSPSFSRPCSTGFYVLFLLSPHLPFLSPLVTSSAFSVLFVTLNLFPPFDCRLFSFMPFLVYFSIFSFPYSTFLHFVTCTVIAGLAFEAEHKVNLMLLVSATVDFKTSPLLCAL